MNQPNKRVSFAEWASTRTKMKAKARRRRELKNTINSIKETIQNFLNSNRFDFACYFWLFLFIVALVLIGLNMGFIK